MHDSSSVVPQTSSQLSTQTSKPLTNPKPSNKKMNSNSFFNFTKISWTHVEGKQDEDHTTSNMHKRQLHEWCSEIDACVNSAEECEEEAKNTGFEDFFIGVCSKEGKGSQKASADEQECSPLLGNEEVRGESVCNRYLYDTYCCEGTKDSLKSETEQEKVTTIEEELGLKLEDEDIFALAKGLLEETTQQTKAQDDDSNKGKSCYKRQSLICKKWVKTFSARIRQKISKCK